MEPWMHDAALLESIRSSCRSVLACTSGIDEGVEDREGAATKLAASIRELRGLLLQLMPEPPQAAGDIAPASSPVDATATPPTTLLHLPDELLTPIIHVVGKDTRAVCRRLRDAYGCPGCVIKHPPSHPTMESSDPNEPLYHESTLQFCRRALAKLTPCLPSLDIFGAGKGMAWHSWAAGVTRLELSDACPLDAAALERIHAALPGLRQLGCGGMYHLVDREGSRLPQLTVLTTLCLISSREEVLRTVSPSFGLLAAAPNVQRLHLDLQRVKIDNGSLGNALRSLAQLTHLELACEPSYSVQYNVQDSYREVCRTLQSLDKLRSLVLLTSVRDLLPHQLLVALQAMTSLTCLGVCCIDFHKEDTEALALASQCLKLASLRELVLEFAMYGRIDMFRNTAEALTQQVAKLGAEAGSSLQALALPVLFVEEHELEAPEVELPRMRALLEAVVGTYPGLTSLQVGLEFSDEALYWFQDGDGEMDEGGNVVPWVLPDLVPWLPPVCRLEGLQQLVLSMVVGEVDMLACLAQLPVLRELWLSFHDYLSEAFDVRMYRASYPQLAAGPYGGAVALLTSLEVLSVSVQAGHDLLVPGLLEAAARLPRLQVLRARVDLHRLGECEAPCRPLAARPPPCLKEVELTTRCTNHKG